MTKEDKKECCSCGSGKGKIVEGFQFGIGLSLAFMAATLVVIILSTVIYYLAKAAG